MKEALALARRAVVALEAIAQVLQLQTGVNFQSALRLHEYITMQTPLGPRCGAVINGVVCLAPRKNEKHVAAP